MKTSPILALVGLLSLSALATPAAAQQEPSPLLEPFARMLGDWQGSGTYINQSGESGTWRATVHIERDLAGHAVSIQNELHDSDGEVVNRVQQIYAVDSQSQELTKISFNSNGNGIGRSRAVWTDADTLVVSSSTFGQNGLTTGRDIWRFTDDSIAWSRERATGVAPFVVRSMGTLARLESRPTSAVEASHSSVPAASPEMEKMLPFLGEFKFVGSALNPEEPDGVSEFSGTKSERMLPGGYILRDDWALTPNAEGFSNAGYGFTYWSPEAEAYLHVSLSNTGGFYTDRVALGEDGALSTFMSRADATSGTAVRMTLTPMEGGELHQNYYVTGATGDAVESWSLVATPVK